MGDGMVRYLISCYKVISHHRVVGVVERGKVGGANWASIWIFAAIYQRVECIDGVGLNGIVGLGVEAMSVVYS